MYQAILPRVLVALALGTFATACGEDPGPSEPPPDSGVPLEQPGYVVIAQGEELSYLVHIPEIGADVTSDLDGVEIPGAAIGVSFGDDPYVYVGSDNAPEIVRYEVRPEGIVEDTRISFTAYGSTSTSGYQSNLLLVNETKAYFIDNKNSQVIVWNPSEMTITKAISHESINEAGVRTGVSGFPLLADGKLYIGLGWLDAATLEVVGGAAVLVIDTATDEATVVRDEAERCGYSFSVVEGSDGIYVGTEAYGAAQHALSAATAAPCMLRLDPTTLAFDADYQVDLEGLVGGAPAGTLVPGPVAGEAYLRVLDETALGMTVDAWKVGGDGGGPVGNGRVLSSRPAWGWYALTLGDTPSATPLEHPASSGATLRIDTGADLLIPEFDNANGRTHLRDFSGNVYGDIALDAQGHVRAVARVLVAR